MEALDRETVNNKNTNDFNILETINRAVEDALRSRGVANILLAGRTGAVST